MFSNSPLEIADSTTPKKIVTGVIGGGGVFHKYLLFNTLIKNCIEKPINYTSR
jgi:hypothetical protein